MNKQTWLVVALILSFGVNLLFVGVVIGRVMSAPSDGKPPLNWMMQELDESTRAELRTSFREHMRNTRSMRRDLRSAQEDLHRLITSDEYDEAAVKAGMAELRRRTETLQETMHTHVAEIMANLEPEERVRVMKFIANPRGRSSSRRPPGD